MASTCVDKQHPKTVYLNNAASAWPKAPGVGQVLSELTEKMPLHPGRSGYATDDPSDTCRQLLAGILGGVEPSRIILCQNATHALNLAILGLGLRNGDAVVTTAQEHNSVLRPLFRLRDHTGIQLRVAPVDNQGRILPEEFEQILRDERPRLVVLNHASNVTGAVQAVEQLFHLAREMEAVTLLDASQSLGLENISPRKVKADIVAFTGHKYLLGPTGTGGLYISPSLQLEPALVGGTGIQSDLEEMPSGLPGELEPGTPNLPAFAGLAHALQWAEENPQDGHTMIWLCHQMEHGLIEAGARVIAPGEPRTPVMSFTIPGWKLEDAGYALQVGFGIHCRAGLHCAPLIHNHIGTQPEGTLRFSLSRFTTEEGVNYAVRSVWSLMQ